MVAFVYLMFILCLSNFWKELRTSGVGWLHDSILSPPFFFEPVLQGIKDLKCRMITFFNLISTSFFKHFLPGIIGLRFRMVTFFYLSFTFFFEHFLQRTMDLRHKLITSPQRHLTNSLQTACGHLTIVRGDLSLTDFHPPSLNVNLPGHGFWRRRGLRYI